MHNNGAHDLSKTTKKMNYVTTVGFNTDFGGRGFEHPASLAIRDDGVIFVASRGKRTSKQTIGIQRVSKNHEFFGKIGSYGLGELGQMVWPTCVTLDLDNNLFLADEFLNRITIFDPDGEPVKYWGEKGSDPGQFDQPSGLLVRGETILVVDSKNNRIQEYNLDGGYISQWGEEGVGPGQFSLPWGICEDSHGYIYIADWRNDRIQKFTSKGEFVESFGESGSSEGKFNRPSDVAVDTEGNIIVTDWANQRLQILDREGNFLIEERGKGGLNPWAEEYFEAQQDEKEARASFVPVFDTDVDDPSEISARIEPYFWDPVSVELDSDDNIYITESNRHRFQVFEFCEGN